MTCFSVLPSAANRAALSRATSASSPILTRAVFSFTPVSLEALSNTASSILSVVLMHISMHDLSIPVNMPSALTSLGHPRIPADSIPHFCSEILIDCTIPSEHTHSIVSSRFTSIDHYCFHMLYGMYALTVVDGYSERCVTFVSC